MKKTYTKTEIETLLSAGTVEEKALLYLNDNSRDRFNMKRILNDKQSYTLFQDIAGSNEFSKLRFIDSCVTDIAQRCKLLVSGFRSYYFQFSEIIASRVANENFEQSVNMLLSGIQPTEKRVLLAQAVIATATLERCKATVEDSGYIKLSYETDATNVKNAIIAITRLLEMIKGTFVAYEEFCSTFNYHLTAYDNEIKTAKKLMVCYPETYLGKFQARQPKDQNEKGKIPFIEQLIKNINCYPIYSQIKPDEKTIKGQQELIEGLKKWK